MRRDGTWRWARQHGIVVRGPDGRARRMVGVTGDITETRQRERQFDTAKAEAAAAHRDVEQAREMMQTVLDNMSDGVTLFDKDFRWRFSNRRHIESWGYTPERLHPGVSGRELIRFQIVHGAHGELGDLDSGSTRSPSACSSRAATATRGASSGQYIEFSYKPARRRQPARRVSRHHRAEGARGGARGRQGGRRSRAQRRRAHARHDADRARQHERRRHVVRQGDALAVHQPSAQRVPALLRDLARPGVSA